MDSHVGGGGGMGVIFAKNINVEYLRKLSCQLVQEVQETRFSFPPPPPPALLDLGLFGRDKEVQL